MHYDDFEKAGINKEQLKEVKNGVIMRFEFTCMNYIGKYKESKKAVDIKLIEVIRNANNEMNNFQKEPEINKQSSGGQN